MVAYDIPVSADVLNVVWEEWNNPAGVAVFQGYQEK
jgi:hypothetical protein